MPLPKTWLSSLRLRNIIWARLIFLCFNFGSLLSSGIEHGIPFSAIFGSSMLALDLLLVTDASIVYVKSMINNGKIKRAVFRDVHSLTGSRHNHSLVTEIHIPKTCTLLERRAL